MADHNGSIDYTPTPVPSRTRWEATKQLVDRRVREGRQARAAADNAPLRAAEADRKARQPGNAS